MGLPCREARCYCTTSSLHAFDFELLHVLQRWVAWKKVFTLQEPDKSRLVAINWSPDGHHAAVQRSDGTLEVLCIDQTATHRVASSSTRAEDLTPLFWAVATRRLNIDDSDEEASGSIYQHVLLRMPQTATSSSEVLRRLHPPEPLPPYPDDGSVGFLAWDTDNAASNLRPDSSGAASASSSIRGMGPSISASAVAYGIVPAPGVGGRVATGPLGQAAAAVARLSESLAAGATTVGSGGIRGACAEPRVIVGLPAWPMSVLACCVHNSGAFKGAGLCLLGYGTYPLLRLPATSLVPQQDLSSSATHATPAALSVACDLSSLLSLSASDDDSTSASSASLHLRLIGTSVLSSCAPELQNVGSVLTLGDSCLRHMARSVSYMVSEWNSAHAAIVSAFSKLEDTMKKLSTDPTGFDKMRFAAAAYYPESPVALATSELFRLLMVGASSGALAAWLEAGIDEAGLVRLSRSIESALAALESLVVTRAARSCEMLLLCLCSLLEAVSDDDGETVDTGDDCAAERRRSHKVYTSLGISRQQLEACIEEVTHFMTLLQALRCAAAFARATYSALLLHLRLLQTAWALASGGGDGDDAAARSRRLRNLPTLAVQDAHMLRAALQPAAVPDIERARRRVPSGTSSGSADGDVDLGSGAAASGGFDPLGLGSVFGSPLSPAPAATSSSHAEPAKQQPASLVDQPKHDAFLSCSLRRLIADPSALAAGAAAGAPDHDVSKALLSIVEQEMSSYTAAPSSMAADVGGSSESQAAHEGSLASQVFAIHARWKSLCAAPCTRLSAVAATALEIDIPLPDSTAPSHSALARAVCKASCLAYDDRDIENADGASDGGGATGGAHVALLSIPASMAHQFSDGDLNLSVILVLRISTAREASVSSSDPVTTTLHASVVLLSPNSNMISSSFYGPGPGAVAMHLASSFESGPTFLPAPQLDSDDARCFSVLIHGLIAEDAAGSSSIPPASLPVHLAQLEYRNLPFAACPPGLHVGCSDMILQWALQHAPRTPIADAAPRCRNIGPLPGQMPAHVASDANSLFAWATRSVSIDSCGPRGAVAVVRGSGAAASSSASGSSGPRQVMIFDMAEDEDEEGDGAPEESAGEHEGSAADMNDDGE